MEARRTARSIRIALATSLGCALLLGATQPALAYFDNYLSGSIIGTLNQKEAASLQQIVRKALNDTADNQAVTWNYPAAGRRQAIDGTVTPVATKEDKGQQCRRLKSDLKRGSATEAWSGWFCKQSSGAWKARHVAD
ncbi:RT0821/Lpp0805 family surface protein [Cupriavidus campinensis]